ncbi:16S rRNA (cytosine(967)-C(5))-methyltransferase RsmB [Herbaspirillum sp. RTI4]|uniref:16S rRNA (cytosine(967)-C(5))-methyltransferase RsmB n=1 Tax=Herbaspirillum sp. RTI4 TaxID=3048640 RepID=UPI002AB43FF8|nr:16S rRNA (cytosine(967)-C(5))-methyltransferase RsmB [Herbaspirillum sp. RTI4]MDY7577300.1 16S rRNA (cytosine(967)-C(5))-methyltransferase RsmB [Herbaspirillum sp. RTI4]MEA9982934.1 16S rRNA (cytosine(967)-C(5))-methyltransferase RsmB [Herbaspirillum sp. RTI4]
MTTTLSLHHDSLAFQLHGAARAVSRVLAGGALPLALTQVFTEMDAPPGTRGAIQDIAYRTIRGLGMAEVLLGLLTTKAPQPPILHGLLCCALALAAERGEAAYPSFTLVDQAVAAAADDPDMAHAKGMVNAVLRRFLREEAMLLEQAGKTPPGAWNYPTWWIDRMREVYPRDWKDILTAGNQPPPLTLRVNRRRTSVADYLLTLEQRSMSARQIGPDAIRLLKPVPVAQLPGFADGLISVQDAATQQAAPLLDVQDGMRVLDACAAPGGKTGHLLEVADLDLYALDHDPRRLTRVQENLDRLQLQAHLVCGDATGRDWWDGLPFDRILADVPCTASGIVRRHPDIRWLRRKSDTLQLATLSTKILDNLWQMLRPDGKLLLVTCSVWPQESEQQASAFAIRNQAIRLPAPGQLLPTANAEVDHDGLFYALFQKPGVLP